MEGDQALRGIIHDLSNALTVILGWAEAARDQDDATRRHALSVIEDRARSAHLLARRAIGVESGRDVASLGALCTKLRESMQVTAARRNLTLALETASCESLEVEGASDLEQAVQNLLFNAFEHAPVGSTVRLSLAADATHYFVTVSDEGAGVPESQREDLFQGHSTREGGTGLGLMHSRCTAESYGGSLDLAPSERGAVFVLRWSRVRPSASIVGLAGAEVVLVEDDDAIADLVTLGLGARGATVIRARSLAELQTVVPPGCLAVLLDWSPITGDATAWQAAIQQQAPGARLVVVTGQPERVTLAGVRILAKPFELKELLALLLDG